MSAARLALALLLALAGTGSPAADDRRAERHRIERERAQAHARYAERERECRRRFVVSGCVEAARAERREALDHLREQQRLLDEAERRRRAGQRMQRLREKVDAAAPAQ